MIKTKLKITNSLTCKKELFQPLNPPFVKMYCCGPTVYDFLHIGNFRGAVFFNFLRQWLEHIGYKVTYVYNFTDVDDKILNRAKKENQTMRQVADKYILEFKKDFKALKLRKHDHNPQATEFIPQIIAFIDDLIKKNKAYVVDGDVFFSVNSFSEYGKLSRRKKDELLSGARVEVDSRKKDPKDFALWKACPESEPGWPTPWGRGRPGWHIECSTMILSILGSNIDIHGGGSDLIFPHHENEIAQSQSVQKTPFVKYWIHNNMFTFGGEKMAKSKGNVNIMRDFLNNYPGEVFKYLVLCSHYRSPAEVSDNKILQCIQALVRIYQFLKTAHDLSKLESVDIPSQTPLKKIFTHLDKQISSAEKDIIQYINDDFNTPSLIAVMFTLIREFNDIHLSHGGENPIEGKKPVNPSSSQEQKKVFTLLCALRAKQIKNIITKYGKLMSLFQELPHEFLQNIDKVFLKKKGIKTADVERLIKEREQARKSKNYHQADEIREKLFKMGIEVQDSTKGTTWETKKEFSLK